MADEFQLTRRPIRVAVATRQALVDALDISDYDQLDAMCTIDGVEGTSSTGLAIRLIGGMQKESEVGWVQIVAFNAANLTAVGLSDAVSASQKLFKYLRWEVTGLGGATALVFDIGGMLRKIG